MTYTYMHVYIYIHAAYVQRCVVGIEGYHIQGQYSAHMESTSYLGSKAHLLRALPAYAIRIRSGILSLGSFKRGGVPLKEFGVLKG